MLKIPSRDGAALPGVYRIELFSEVGALIDRLRIGVAEEKLRAGVPVAKGGFKCIVVRVGHRFIGCIFSVVFALPDERSAALSDACSIDRFPGTVDVG